MSVVHFSPGPCEACAATDKLFADEGPPTITGRYELTLNDPDRRRRTYRCRRCRKPLVVPYVEDRDG